MAKSKEKELKQVYPFTKASFLNTIPKGDAREAEVITVEKDTEKEVSRGSLGFKIRRVAGGFMYEYGEPVAAVTFVSTDELATD